MKAMLLRRHAPIGSKPLESADVPKPTPAPHEVLIRVLACGICRTDLHVIEGELPSQKLPLIPGHQVVGIVDERGDACSRFKKGDRIGVAWLRRTCGQCEFCLSGKENLCGASRYTGYHEHGGYAEYAVIHEDYAYEIPPTFSDEEAAPLLCAGIIGYRALARADLPPKGKLGLFGFGSSAHIMMQIALHRGAEVFVATRGEKHQHLAKTLGASWVGDTYAPFPTPVDSAIVFAPVGDIVPTALASVKKGGTVSLAGIHMSTIPSMDYEKHLFHEKNLRSVEANTRQDGEQLLAEASRIPIRPRVQVFSLEQANEALIRLKTDGIEGTGILQMKD